MKLRISNPLAAYGLAILFVALAFTSRWTLAPLIGDIAPFMLFLLAAILSGVFGGLGPGLVAMVSGLFLAHYFFVIPRYTYFPVDLKTWVYWAMYSTVSLVSLGVVQALHRASAQSEQSVARAKRHEEQLRTIIREMSAAQERIRELASVVESADDAILSMTTGGAVKSWNAGAERLFGYTAAEMIGKPFARIVPEDRLSEHRSMLTRVIAGESLAPLETIRITKPGTALNVSLRLSPLRDKDGKVTGISAIARDISSAKVAEAEINRLNENLSHNLSELKEAHAELVETEQRFRTVADTAPLMIWMTDADRHRTWVNKPWRVFPGRDSELETPEGWEEPIHPDDRLQWNNAVEHATASGESFEIEYRLKKADGEWRWVLDRGVPRFDQEGRFMGCIGSCMDVTDWKQAEEALEKKFDELRQAQTTLREQNDQLARSRRDLENERARYRELFDSAPSGYVITSRQGVIQQVNQAAAELLGESASFLEGFPLARLLAKQDRPAFFANIGKLTRNEVNCIQGWEATVAPHNREPFACSVVVNLLQGADAGVAGLRWILRDITDRKEAENRILRLNAELEQRVKERTAALESANRELEAFSYSVSHDLRAPLRSINGFSKAVLEEYSDRLDEQGIKYLRYAHDASVRMGHLIEDLLQLSRVSRGELHSQKLDLSGLIASVASDIANRHPKQRVTLTVQSGLWVNGDGGLVRIALENLLSNAWKFSSGREHSVIEAGLTIYDDRPCMYVRDNGAGFNMNAAGRLFGVFQRLHSQEEFPGTGIGLATVRRIFSRHGGYVWAESKLNEGATFFFTLPQMGIEPRSEHPTHQKIEIHPQSEPAPLNLRNLPAARKVRPAA